MHNQGVLAGQVSAPMATGVHELMVLWVENPSWMLHKAQTAQARYHASPSRLVQLLRRLLH